MAHALNPRTWEAEVVGFLHWGPESSIEGVLGQPKKSSLQKLKQTKKQTNKPQKRKQTNKKRVLESLHGFCVIILRVSLFVYNFRVLVKVFVGFFRRVF